MEHFRRELTSMAEGVLNSCGTSLTSWMRAALRTESGFNRDKRSCFRAPAIILSALELLPFPLVSFTVATSSLGRTGQRKGGYTRSRSVNVAVVVGGGGGGQIHRCRALWPSEELLCSTHCTQTLMVLFQCELLNSSLSKLPGGTRLGWSQQTRLEWS